jgi:hypothetical protein
MIKSLDDAHKLSKENMDVALQSFGAVSTKMQAIAAEVADYSKKSFEDSTAVVEKLMGAKSVEKAIEVQTDYVKLAYESFMSEASKLGDLYSDLAKETYKPFENAFARQTAA